MPMQSQHRQQERMLSNDPQQLQRGSPLSRQHQVAKSYNFDSMKDKSSAIRGFAEEPRTSKGYIIALACGPLKKQRYINPKIESELADFKKEIDDKFKKSELSAFVFPRPRL